jgi:hypothetical protein
VGLGGARWDSVGLKFTYNDFLNKKKKNNNNADSKPRVLDPRELYERQHMYILYEMV